MTSADDTDDTAVIALPAAQPDACAAVMALLSLISDPKGSWNSSHIAAQAVVQSLA